MPAPFFSPVNMVRAGVVSHPRDWEEAGYHEIQRGRGRYRIVDRAALSGRLGVPENRLAGMQVRPAGRGGKSPHVW